MINGATPRKRYLPNRKNLVSKDLHNPWQLHYCSFENLHCKISYVCPNYDRIIILLHSLQSAILIIGLWWYSTHKLTQLEVGNSVKVNSSDERITFHWSTVQSSYILFFSHSYRLQKVWESSMPMNFQHMKFLFFFVLIRFAKLVFNSEVTFAVVAYFLSQSYTMLFCLYNPIFNYVYFGVCWMMFFQYHNICSWPWKWYLVIHYITLPLWSQTHLLGRNQ